MLEAASILEAMLAGEEGLQDWSAGEPPAKRRKLKPEVGPAIAFVAATASLDTANMSKAVLSVYGQRWIKVWGVAHAFRVVHG